MKILAIDPGYDRIGVAVLEKNNGKDICIFSTCIQTDRSLKHTERLFYVGNAMRALIQEHAPTHCAIEKLFFNKNQKTVMAVAEVRGALIYLAHEYGLALHEYGPQEIKVAMTGYGKSDKSAVQDMIMRLVVNAPEKALDDEYDAIAVGVTCLASLRAYTENL